MVILSGGESDKKPNSLLMSLWKALRPEKQFTEATHNGVVQVKMNPVLR